MRKNTLILGVIGLFISASSIGQSNDLSASILPKKEVGSTNSADVIWSEDIGEITLTTATYHSNDGQIKIVNSSVPINYYVNQELVPIDPTLKRAPK